MTDLQVSPRTDNTQLATAILILRALDAESTTAGDVAAAIEGDPALGQRLLRLARSPMFGIAADDLTVRRAVVLVGFKTVRNVAVLSAARSLTDGAEDGNWVHALTTGIATEQLAIRAGVDGADGLVAGLLSVLVDGQDAEADEQIMASVPAHIADAIECDPHTRPPADAAPLVRLVHAGTAIAHCIEQFSPGIPSSSDLDRTLEHTAFPGLGDTRLATDIRRGVDLYANLAS